MPMLVVEDRADLTALAMLPETGYVVLGDTEGNRTRDFVNASQRVHVVWSGTPTLRLLRERDQHATLLFWDEHWNFLCWYINLETPIHRTSFGFESMDLTLDLLIAPDGQSYRWKDEDEFEYGIEHGWYTREQFQELKSYGEHIAGKARRGEPPFGEPWHEWRPDPSWNPPCLPDGWDVIDS